MIRKGKNKNKTYHVTVSVFLRAQAVTSPHGSPGSPGSARHYGEDPLDGSEGDAQCKAAGRWKEKRAGSEKTI